MTNYGKLDESLRCCIPDPPETCEGCTYNTDVGCNVARLMSDAADAIEALQAEVKQAAKRNAELHAELEKWISAAEKAQLPKRGKWIKHEDDACECSVCGLGLESFVEGIFYNFCPFCGADMRAKMEVQDDKA